MRSRLEPQPTSSGTFLGLEGFISRNNHFRGLDVVGEGLEFVRNIVLNIVGATMSRIYSIFGWHHFVIESDRTKAAFAIMKSTSWPFVYVLHLRFCTCHRSLVILCVKSIVLLAEEPFVRCLSCSRTRELCNGKLQSRAFN